VQYMLLIVEPAEQRQTRTEADGRALQARMARFADELRARGRLVASESLRSSASRVRARDGKPSVIDGPFAEAKEMIGGYFLLDCADRDEAVAIARQCPAVAWADVEVREIGPCYT